MSKVLTSQDTNQEPRRFDLFWLTKEELGTLTEGQHHGLLDSPNETKTKINIFRASITIGMALDHLDRPWAITRLTGMKDKGETSFGLSPEFLKICQKLKIDIPFLEIEAGRAESIDTLLKEARQTIEGSKKRTIETL